MLPTVQFKAVGRSDIRRHVEAYRLLFRVEPTLRVTGTLRAKDGDLAFLKNPARVLKVGVVFVVEISEDRVPFSFKDGPDGFSNAHEATFWLSER